MYSDTSKLIKAVQSRVLRLQRGSSLGLLRYASCFFLAKAFFSNVNSKQHNGLCRDPNSGTVSKTRGGRVTNGFLS